MDNDIREVTVEKNEDGKVLSVRIVFGPHYFVSIEPNEEGVLTFYLGATHHGFAADAIQVGKGLEELIWEIREQHPELAID